MNLMLFDDHSWKNLLPLTFTKPAADLRVGILKIHEKWEIQLGEKTSFLTRGYLQTKYPASIANKNLLINGTLLPETNIVKAIKALSVGESLKKGNTLLALNTNAAEFDLNNPDILAGAAEFEGEVSLIDYPWKIFSLNGQEIEKDFQLLTKGKKSEAISTSVNVIGGENIFIEKGFQGEYFTINASSGPVYLGADSEIMEGAVIRGPFALCEHSTVKLSAKIYGPTTIGPHSKAGGEINNAVIQGYSNKGHDGFLGNAVIGEWCNLGADTNNSNLKNNYAEVKIWNYPANSFIKTGLQFCGLIMGDHSKCGINTMFNTGTVVGVSANIFGSGFPRNFIPSFTWGGAHSSTEYKLEKAFETMQLVMERRGLRFSEADKDIYRRIHADTAQYRHK